MIVIFIFFRSPTFVDDQQAQYNSPYAPSPKKPINSPKESNIIQNGHGQVSYLKKNFSQSYQL